MIKTNTLKFPVRKTLSNTNLSNVDNDIIDPNKSLEFRANLGGKNLAFKNGEWISEADGSYLKLYKIIIRYF